MGEWWFVVFWILLIPLIVIELIIFLKSRKFFWLVFALAVFTYIVAVSYTIDVFDLGRNAIILILLASAALMFIIGRQLGKRPRKRVAASEKWTTIALSALIVLLFVISVIFGKAAETTTPVPSLSQSEIVKTYNEQKGIDYRDQSVVVLKRTITNNFFLPVPVKQYQYMGCLVTDKGTFNLDPYSYYEQNEEVGAGETKIIDAKLQPHHQPQTTPLKATELRVYVEDSREYSRAPCETITKEPDYRIPVE